MNYSTIDELLEFEVEGKLKDLFDRDRIVLSHDSVNFDMKAGDLLPVMIGLAGLSKGKLYLRIYHTCEEHPIWTVPFEWPPSLPDVCPECDKLLIRSKLNFDVELVFK
jgi:hypothetical protein